MSNVSISGLASVLIVHTGTDLLYSCNRRSLTSPQSTEICESVVQLSYELRGVRCLCMDSSLANREQVVQVLALSLFLRLSEYVPLDCCRSLSISAEAPKVSGLQYATISQCCISEGRWSKVSPRLHTLNTTFHFVVGACSAGKMFN